MGFELNFIETWGCLKISMKVFVQVVVSNSPNEKVDGYHHPMKQNILFSFCGLMVWDAIPTKQMPLQIEGRTYDQVTRPN